MRAALILAACTAATQPAPPRVPSEGVPPYMWIDRWVAPAVLCVGSRLVWAAGWRCA